MPSCVFFSAFKMLAAVFLLINALAYDKLLSPHLDLPPGVNLQRMADETEGHEDLYLASDYPFRTLNGFLWVGVLSATGSTNLEGAHYEWDGVILPSMVYEADRPLIHIVSDQYCLGLVSAKITLASGEEITLKSWMPTKDGCWMSQVRWEAQAGVDEFGEEWPYILIEWYPFSPVISYAVNPEAIWCSEIFLYEGTNPCDSFRGTGVPIDSRCGEMLYKYRTSNVTLVADGDELVQYFAQGRSRRYKPVLDSSLIEELDRRSNRSRHRQEPFLVPCK
eukprot:Gregarina_sp_Pseudo_9__1641@NODE_2102_length_1148_cov_332_299369_g1940_i0_p1_GENE_NODE_2102_length_1148_cov_332_299369_g1940_i0NODE_2102_length_1148_cov_332_299369_g1940_i0_p1_ORF_typecomplete_len278_score4_79PilP/PF04351_13/0_2_NODE_2102_length_1148_cov_332_299369_g1940_i0111944